MAGDLEARLAKVERELARCLDRIAELEGRTETDPLMSLPDETRLYQADLARLFGISERTVRDRVSKGRMPPPVRDGLKPLWLARTIKEHVQYRPSLEPPELRGFGGSVIPTSAECPQNLADSLDQDELEALAREVLSRLTPERRQKIQLELAVSLLTQ